MTLSSNRADRVYFNLGMLSIDRCNLEFGRFLDEEVFV